jgi:multifunctional methyltransferase subunit TRM112
MCNVKGCKTNNFPLRIKALHVEKIESEFKIDFIRHILPKLDWAALVQGAKDVRFKTWPLKMIK